MTRNFISAKPDISVLNAIKLMVKNRVGSLVLTQGDVLNGILTEKDIMWALSKKHLNKDLAEIPAGEICTRKITTIRPSADLYNAIKIMRKAKFRRLPVVIKKKVIGLLTLKDILRIEPELFEIASEHYTIREEPEKLKRKQASEKFQEGLCEECTNFEILYKIDGRLICQGCRNAM